MRKKTIHDTMRRLILTLLLTAFVFSLCVPFVAADDTSGTCGKGLFWTLVGDTLTVSGQGAMTNFTEETMAPWHAFRESIRIVKVEAGVTSVGDLAFYDLPNLISATLPSTVMSIGFASFAECKKLKLLTLGSGLQTIGRSAFECCESLQGVRFSDKLTSIGERAFYRCYALKTITIPASVTKIGKMAFTYCDSLVSAEIHASVSKIPTWLFYDCSSLVQIVVSGNVKSSESGAFEGCDNLNSIKYSGTKTNGEGLLADIQEDFTNLPAMNITYTNTPQKDSVTSSNIQQQEDKTIISSTTVTETGNSLVSTTVSTTVQDDTGRNTNVKIEAVIENENGWDELLNEIKEGEKQNLNNETINVDISLKDSKEISGNTLDALAGKDVDLTIDMNDGSTVKIDCGRLEKPEEDPSEKQTALSYVLISNSNPTKNQIKTIGEATSFLLSFDGSTNFDFSPKIYIGEHYARQTATLYQSVPGKGLELLQSVIVDKSGYATYYLQSTKDTTQYLIALNVKDIDHSTAIIPEDVAADYGGVIYYEKIEYVTTGVRLFMGLSLFQFSIAVFCVMLFLFVAVGIVMSILYRKKKLELYYQQLKAKNV